MKRLNHTTHKEFKRGDRIIDTKRQLYGVVLGPEDFDGYEQNKPSNDSELIKWEVVPDDSPWKTSWYWHIAMEKVSHEA